MARQRSRITGAKEMEQVLKRLPDQLAKKHLRAAVRAGAVVVSKEAKASAPRGQEPAGEYGRLHENISIKLNRKSRLSVHFMVHNGAAFWGLFLEFGTRLMAAIPWFRPAFERSAPAALDKIGDRLGKGLEKEATALAGRYKDLNKSRRRALAR